MPDLDHQLISIQEYKQARFPGRRPCIRTLKNWVESGKLPGEKIGDIWFVKIPREVAEPADPLLEKMIEGT